MMTIIIKINKINIQNIDQEVIHENGLIYYNYIKMK